jgi:hypothetical protein
MGKCEMYHEKNFKAYKREWKVIYKATKMKEMMNFMEKLIEEPLKIENVWSFNRRECWLGNAFLSKYIYEIGRRSMGERHSQRGRGGREGGNVE